MRTVVGRLVAESDRVIRDLVEGWEEERRVGRLVRQPMDFESNKPEAS